MDIIERKEGEALIVSVAGRLDAMTASDFEKRMAERINEGETKLLLNFAQLAYISSAGLRSILTIAKILKGKNGKLLFTGLTGTVKDVFKISGFDTLYRNFSSEAEALKEL